MSYTNHNYHIVYSTKNRQPILSASILPQLVQYSGGIIRNLKGALLEANGPEDHFHLVAILPATLAVSDFVRDLKAGTSGWIHKTFPKLSNFAWQDGYASFSVSHSGVPRVIEYVRNQQEHHKKMSFQEELTALLKRHEIQFDPRYIN